LGGLVDDACNFRRGGLDPVCTAVPGSGETGLTKVKPVGGHLDNHGHTLGLLRLIEAAVAHVRDEPVRCHVLLTKLGNAHYNEGELVAAARAYGDALVLAPGEARRAVLLSLLGKVRAESGDHAAARRHFDEAYAVADATGDAEVRLRVLEQHSVAAFRGGDYTTVRDVAREGLGLSRRLRLPFQEAIFLNNLGTAEFELGVCAAIDLHSRAQAIAVELDNDHLLALTHRTLGADYHAQEDHARAGTHFGHALRLYTRLGQRERERKLGLLMRQFGYLEAPT
jgi:tetratricopeptide (TPR) repeat protein